MKKSQRNLYLLYLIFGVALVTSNCIASKLMIMPFSLFGSPVTVTVGVICYPITFLITDIIGELYGKKHASYAVWFGFIGQIVSTTMIVLAQHLPAADASMQEHYTALLGQNYIFVIASLTAYLVSQSWDVFVFHKLRTWYIKKTGSTKGGKWLWNNVGTITSQLLDSCIYAIIAFGIGFRWLADTSMYSTLCNMILAQFLIKAVLALLDTPLFYLCTRESKGEAA